MQELENNNDIVNSIVQDVKLSEEVKKNQALHIRLDEGKEALDTERVCNAIASQSLIDIVAEHEEAMNKKSDELTKGVLREEELKEKWMIEKITNDALSTLLLDYEKENSTRIAEVEFTNTKIMEKCQEEEHRTKTIMTNHNAELQEKRRIIQEIQSESTTRQTLIEDLKSQIIRKNNKIKVLQEELEHIEHE